MGVDVDGVGGGREARGGGGGTQSINVGNDCGTSHASFWGFFVLDTTTSIFVPPTKVPPTGS